MSELERLLQQSKVDAVLSSIVTEIENQTVSFYQERKYKRLRTLDHLEAWSERFGEFKSDNIGATLEDAIRVLDVYNYLYSYTSWRQDRTFGPWNFTTSPGHVAFYSSGWEQKVLEALAKKPRRRWISAVVLLAWTARQGALARDGSDACLMSTRVLYMLLNTTFPLLFLHMMNMTQGEFARTCMYTFIMPDDFNPDTWLDVLIRTILNVDITQAYAAWPHSPQHAATDVLEVTSVPLSFDDPGIKENVTCTLPVTWSIGTLHAFLISKCLSWTMVLRHIPLSVIEWVNTVTPNVVGSPSWRFVRAFAYTSAFYRIKRPEWYRDSLMSEAHKMINVWWLRGVWSHVILSQKRSWSNTRIMLEISPIKVESGLASMFTSRQGVAWHGTLTDVASIASIRTPPPDGEDYAWNVDAYRTCTLRLGVIRTTTLSEPMLPQNYIFGKIGRHINSQLFAAWIKVIMDYERSFQDYAKEPHWMLLSFEADYLSWSHDVVVSDTRASRALWSLFAFATLSVPHQKRIFKTLGVDDMLSKGQWSRAVQALLSDDAGYVPTSRAPSTPVGAVQRLSWFY